MNTFSNLTISSMKKVELVISLTFFTVKNSAGEGGKKSHFVLTELVN